MKPKSLPSLLSLCVRVRACFLGSSDDRQVGETGGDGEGGAGAFPQPPDAQVARGPQHREVRLPHAGATRGWDPSYPAVLAGC